MIRKLACLLFLAAPVAAEELTMDAFGILPSNELGDRQNWAGLRETSSGQSFIQPAGPTDATILFVGPKSIVAGLEPGHAVAIGVDVHGNMRDAAETQFVLGFDAVERVISRDGIADILFTPPTNAGSYLAGADIEGIQSARAGYRVTAHLKTVLPEFENTTRVIMPETFSVIATKPLVDAYGNPVDDGVGLTVILEDDDGQHTYLPAVVRDGSGQSTLLSRDLSGAISGTLALAGTTTDGLSLVVENMVLADAGAFILWPEPKISAVRLRIGPLSTTSGFLVPDGMSGAVDVTAPDGSTVSAQTWVLDGYLSFTLPVAPTDAEYQITLSMGDNRQMQTVTLSQPPANAVVRGAE